MEKKYKYFSETIADFGCEVMLVAQGLKEETDFTDKAEKLRKKLEEIVKTEDMFPARFVWELADLYLCALDQALSDKIDLDFAHRLYDELEKILAILEKKADI